MTPADGAGRRSTTTSRWSRCRTWPTARARSPTWPAITAAAHAAGALVLWDLSPLGRLGAGTAALGRGRPRRRLHVQAPQRRARARRRSCTCAATCRPSCGSRSGAGSGSGTSSRMGAGYDPVRRRSTGSWSARRRCWAATAALRRRRSSPPTAGIDRDLRQGARRWATFAIELHDAWLAPLGLRAGLAPRPGAARRARDAAPSAAPGRSARRCGRRGDPRLPHPGPAAAGLRAALHPVRRRPRGLGPAAHDLEAESWRRFSAIVPGLPDRFGSLRRFAGYRLAIGGGLSVIVSFAALSRIVMAGTAAAAGPCSSPARAESPRRRHGGPRGGRRSACSLAASPAAARRRAPGSRSARARIQAGYAGRRSGPAARTTVNEATVTLGRVRRGRRSCRSGRLPGRRRDRAGRQAGAGDYEVKLTCANGGHGGDHAQRDRQSTGRRTARTPAAAAWPASGHRRPAGAGRWAGDARRGRRAGGRLAGAGDWSSRHAR